MLLSPSCVEGGGSSAHRADDAARRVEEELSSRGAGALIFGGEGSEHEGLALIELSSLYAAEQLLSERRSGALRLHEGWGEEDEAELSFEAWLWVSAQGALVRPSGGARPGARYSLSWWVGEEESPRWRSSWETPYGLTERHPLRSVSGEEAERAGREVLARSCGCHGGEGAPSLDLPSAARAQSQRDPELKVFAPGAPSESALLLRALEGEVTRGERMPPSPAPPLSRADLSALERWILSR